MNHQEKNKSLLNNCSTCDRDTGIFKVTSFEPHPKRYFSSMQYMPYHYDESLCIGFFALGNLCNIISNWSKITNNKIKMGFAYAGASASIFSFGFLSRHMWYSYKYKPEIKTVFYNSAQSDSHSEKTTGDTQKTN